MSNVDEVAASYARGLDLLGRGEHFAAHEELEQAWRAAAPAERCFFQGLVHVAVAWHHAGRGNRVGCERQLAKALRRLSPYAPAHRGLDVSSLLAQLEDARTSCPHLTAVRLECLSPGRRSRGPG